MSLEFVSFLPPFFGVLAAFVLQWLAKRHEKGKDRKKFLSEIKRELKKGSSLLVGEGVLLPTDIWESGKSSGLLGLLDSAVKLKLASVYFDIQGHNYESVKVRDVGILAETTKAEKPKAEILVDFPAENKVELFKTNFTHAQLLWNALSDRLRNSEKNLKKTIEDTIASDIWG